MQTTRNPNFDSLLQLYPQNVKILLIGTIPPPLGGVSVHTKRLFHLLKNRGTPVEIFDPSRHHIFRGHEKIALLVVLLWNNFGIVHFQGFDFSRSLLRLILIARSLMRFKLYATAHSCRLSESTPLKAISFQSNILSKLDCLVAVHHSILEKYAKLKIPIPAQSLVVPAFLPPDESEENRIWSSYPDELSNFLSNHKPILVANAFRIIFYMGEDLYGIDLSIELTKRLLERYPRIGVIFALADDSEEIEYLNILQRKMIDLGIQDNFLMLKGQRELWPLLKRADLMLRPTNSDGDAISIREALYFGHAVVASDVCERPPGVTTFASRNIEDFEEKVSRVLSEKRFHIQN